MNLTYSAWHGIGATDEAPLGTLLCPSSSPPPVLSHSPIDPVTTSLLLKVVCSCYLL